ncbi:MAG TPA: Hsp20/alpha crystallin family protein [Bacteroidia bacterium]|nr:Hsp20/alpha crystallin family protein [Bacteroidia bacterium]
MTLIKWSKPSVINHGNDVFSWSPLSVMDDFFSSQMSGRASFVPAVNISEKETNFLVEVSAPGFKKEDFKILSENGVLTISSEHTEEKKEENAKFTRREFRKGSFSRSFTLPENVNTENISAAYENGVLSVELPKKEVEANKAAKEIKVS